MSGLTRRTSTAGVRIIFKDFEPSNWTFDHEAGQYFWHRFFHHQPDLNFDNPAVHQAVFERAATSGWQAGVDGLRLDAVPYLYEREGTSCENLEETHGLPEEDCGTYVDDAMARPNAAGRGKPVA